MKFLNFITNINLVLGSFLCWNENDIGLRCQWNNTVNGRVEYSKASDYIGEKYRDCYHDRDLVTISKNGCAIHGMNFNPNIRYNLELFDIDHPSNNPISTIDGFEPREYLKITIPPRDFSAERRINGEVLLKWKNDPRLILMFHILQDSLLYRLVYNARMEIEENYQILGLQQELQQQVTLNNLPSNQILELCLQIRKRGSKISDWSQCSNKAILRTRVISTIMAPTVTVTTPEPSLRDKKRERRIILISVVVLVSTVLVTVYCIKLNWRQIKNTVFPPIQPPDNNLYFDRTEYSVSRYSSGRTEVEAHDELNFGHSNGVPSDRNGLIGNISNRTEETTFNSTNIANSSITPLPNTSCPTIEIRRSSLDSGFGSPEPASRQDQTPVDQTNNQTTASNQNVISNAIS